MESDPATKPKTTTSRSSHFQTFCDAIEGEPRYLWAASAATSLLTLKHLFVTAGLNFPVQIGLLHWIVIAIYLALDHIWYRQQYRKEPTPVSSVPWTQLAALGSIMALSVGFTLQALLHFHSTVAFAMFATVCTCVLL
jgi:hypothetical protein